MQLLDLALGEDEGRRLRPDRGFLQARCEFAGTGACIFRHFRRENLGQFGRGVSRMLPFGALAVACRHFEPVERFRPVLRHAAPGLMEQCQIELRLGHALKGRTLVPGRGLGRIFDRAAPGLMEEAQVELSHRVAPLCERTPCLRGLPVVAGFVGGGAVRKQVGCRRPGRHCRQEGCGEEQEGPCAGALTRPDGGVACHGAATLSRFAGWARGSDSAAMALLPLARCGKSRWVCVLKSAFRPDAVGRDDFA